MIKAIDIKKEKVAEITEKLQRSGVLFLFLLVL